MTAQGKSPTLDAREPSRTFFSVEQANKALPYVSRVVSDVRDTYRHAVGLQQRLESPMPTDNLDELGRDYTKSVDRLNGYVEELHTVGVDLKDYDLGLIDFPAMHDGREVCLCWKHGEDAILAWHEVDAGFAGRRSIDTLELADEADADA